MPFTDSGNNQNQIFDLDYDYEELYQGQIKWLHYAWDLTGLH